MVRTLVIIVDTGRIYLWIWNTQTVFVTKLFSIRFSVSVDMLKKRKIAINFISLEQVMNIRLIVDWENNC